MPDPDDPFFNMDDEHTIIKPNPGGRAQARAQRPEPRHDPGEKVELASRPGLNALEKSAAVLLNILSQIRNTGSHPNPTGLHKQLATEIQSFERSAQQAGVSPETTFIARYAICTTIDEFVMSTPWGSGSIWSSQSLLSLFHKEVRGGERFFKMLAKLQQDPARNIDLLELLYICLSLGFQGQYRISPNGINELEEIREGLYYTIRNQRLEPEAALSPHWEGLNKSAVAKAPLIPVWMLTSIVLLLLVGLFSLWHFNLSSYVDPVRANLMTVGRNDDQLLPVRVEAPAPARYISDPGGPRFDLKRFLAAEISRGQVSVEEYDNRIEVLIPGEELFESGSEIIKRGYLDIIQKIGEGLEQTTGRIKVVGHTDNVPMRRTQRFSSNIDLSQGRADSVVRLLTETVRNEARLSAEGLGETQPVASNATAEGRARNRRVEIILMERARGS